MTNEDYNGWSNWATEKIASHLRNNLYLDLLDRKPESEEGYRDFVADFLDSNCQVCPKWFYDEVSNAHSRCNYSEIAEKFNRR